MTLRTKLLRTAVALCAMVALVGCGDDSVTDGTTTSSPSAPGSTAPGDTAPGDTQPEDAAGIETLRIEVVEERMSDPSVFTQGLELHDDALYVSGGLYGESLVRVVDPNSGEVRGQIDLDDDVFGEGLTVIDDEVIVLTWREKTALVLDAKTLEERRRHTYDTEGWGLCDDGDRLVMSDGTATLRFRDRETFEQVGSVEVTLDDQPLTQLNELECVGDHVWANVWHDNHIVRIDPDTGRVTAIADASSLVPPSVRNEPESVLNGIAHDPDTNTFLVTGKRWPALFVVRFVPAG